MSSHSNKPVEAIFVSIYNLYGVSVPTRYAVPTSLSVYDETSGNFVESDKIPETCIPKFASVN